MDCGTDAASIFDGDDMEPPTDPQMNFPATVVCVCVILGAVVYFFAWIGG